MAALLHDTVEDSDDGWAVERRIRARFGDRVADIVMTCSDAIAVPGEPKPPWHARKQQYIDDLETASEDALLVSACDKLHNARSVLGDLRIYGDDLWQRFSTKSGPDQIWYYATLADLFSRRMPGRSPTNCSGSSASSSSSSRRRARQRRGDARMTRDRRDVQPSRAAASELCCGDPRADMPTATPVSIGAQHRTPGRGVAVA